MLKESAIPYGMNITASDAQGAIKEAYKDRAGVNTWTKLLNQAGADYTREMSALQEDYSEAIGEAYKSSLKNRENIDRLGLATGSRNELLSENRNALMDAYETYLSKYASGAATAMENYGSNVSAIEQALGDEAGNVSKILGKIYDYAASTWSGDSAKYMYELFDKYGLGDVFNREEVGLVGNEKQYDYGVKSWDELQNLIYDENHQMTKFGRDFYLRTLDLTGTEAEGVSSFGRWLAENDPELLEWFNSADPYNYTEDGRRSGTIRKLLGQGAQDYGNALSASDLTKEKSSLNKDIEQGVKDIVNPIDDYIANKGTEKTFRDALDKFTNFTPAAKDEIASYGLDSKEEFVNQLAKADMKASGSTESVENWLNRHRAEYEKAYDKIRDYLVKNENPLPDRKSLEGLRETYNSLYGEGTFDESVFEDYEAAQSLLAKDKLSNEELDTLYEKLGNVSNKLGGYKNLYNGAEIDKTGYVAEEHRAKNASIALEKIKSAEGKENYNATVDYAYDKVSKDLTVILEESPKLSRNRDIVISYGDKEYFTLDKKTGATPLIHTTETYQALSKYGDSLLAVYDDGLYMQYKKGEWIRVVPKIGGDKGYSDHNKEMDIAKVIAYKMMQNNKMSIRGEDSELSYTAKQVWSGAEIGGR